MRNRYYSFVYPYLIDCIEVWGNAHDTYLDPLIKLQKKCIRVIIFSFYLEHTTPLFEQLDILSFKNFVMSLEYLYYKRIDRNKFFDFGRQPGRLCVCSLQ